jgi:hypothetical protein
MTSTVESVDAFEAIELYFEKGWTDGLPIVPPRPEMVERFIATVGRDPNEVLITLNETNMQCTLEAAATNAVMAGCKPEYFPVVVAAVECWNDPRWGSTNVYLSTASTGGAGSLVIVNGPVRNELSMNSGVNLFASGPAFRANATIGRAVRLIMLNALGMTPQVFDMSIMGHPGKFSYCIAEAEEESPWEPYHVERGFRADESTVTVLPGKGPVPVDERNSDTPEPILDAVATVMPHAFGTGIYAIVMGTEHAQIIGGKNRWTKKMVKEYLFEKTMRPLPPGALRRGPVKTIDGVDYRPLVRVPDDLALIVAGGGNGGLTAVIPTHVYNVPPGDLVTRAIQYRQRIASG